MISAEARREESKGVEGTDLVLDVVGGRPALDGRGVDDGEGDVPVIDDATIDGRRGDVAPACRGRGSFSQCAGHDQPVGSLSTHSRLRTLTGPSRNRMP